MLLGLAGNLCPDHYFVTNIEACARWGQSLELDILISESAGLCNRCSPFIRQALAVCVIDNLSGANTPTKMGPLLKQADIVAITKGDIVSQAEREVFQYQVRKVNARAEVLQINGLTGQGKERLGALLTQAQDIDTGRTEAPFLDACRGLFLLPGRNQDRERLSNGQCQEHCHSRRSPPGGELA